MSRHRNLLNLKSLPGLDHILFRLGSLPRFLFPSINKRQEPIWNMAFDR